MQLLGAPALGVWHSRQVAMPGIRMSPVSRLSSACTWQAVQASISWDLWEYHEAGSHVVGIRGGATLNEPAGLGSVVIAAVVWQ